MYLLPRFHMVAAVTRVNLFTVNNALFTRNYSPYARVTHSWE